MSDSQKLTPAEFLAQLKQRSPAKSGSTASNGSAGSSAKGSTSSAPAPNPPARSAAATATLAKPKPAAAKSAAAKSAAAVKPTPTVKTPPAKATSAAADLDGLDLDFSDLDAPATTDNAEAAAPAAVAVEAPPTESTAPKEPPEAGAGKGGAGPTIFLKRHSHLSELFERVNKLLGSQDKNDGPYRPRSPENLDETRLTQDEVERLALKYLLAKGTSSGRGICSQIKLPFTIVDPILKQLKSEQLVAYRGTAEMGDYEYVITDFGRERARRFAEECSYYGAAPVSLQDYLKAMAAQSIADQVVTAEHLHKAFKDLIISREMLDQLGPAINSGRGMFLFGEPGNGKTSIAERITQCFGSSIWIPRALGIDGDIIRLFDPGVHDTVEDAAAPTLFQTDVDQRWVHIVRPTVIAGGELTMKELEVTQNMQTKVCEAPLQLKSNCGTFVIDDFGRQTMPVTVLLNRWIVPLEKRYDFLNLPSGKKVQVPFDQLIIFSTNLEPKDLVDGAFLRRIPYKIQVPDPTEEEFHKIFQAIAPKMGFTYDRSAIDYLIMTHFRGVRPLRSCQPRDLMLQVKNFCTYRGTARKITPEAFDFAVKNYFSVL